MASRLAQEAGICIDLDVGVTKVSIEVSPVNQGRMIALKTKSSSREEVSLCLSCSTHLRVREISKFLNQ